MFAYLKVLSQSGNLDAFQDAIQNGLGLQKTAKMTYDFTVDGGAISTIVPVNSPTLPDDAIIVGGVIEITVAPSGASTIAIGTSAGSSNASLKAATAAATYALNTQIPLIPVWTAASAVKLTAAGRINMTIAGGALGAGKFAVHVQYFSGNA